MIKTTKVREFAFTSNCKTVIQNSEQRCLSECVINFYNGKNFGIKMHFLN